MTAQAALTAQNTQGVRAIHEVPSDFVKQQIEACIEDVGVDVVKTGMVEAILLHIKWLTLPDTGNAGLC